ncbi:hypothetical protein KCP71_18130 [Salmonella enterica subsp. enterica]|nr:hypothetical protein KCP71_18130 [Salmonella enterica subsp. enterica]
MLIILRNAPTVGVHYLCLNCAGRSEPCPRSTPGIIGWRGGFSIPLQRQLGIFGETHRHTYRHHRGFLAYYYPQLLPPCDTTQRFCRLSGKIFTIVVR